VAVLDSVLRSNGVTIQESAIGISTVDPDRDKLIEEGFRRLTKTQNERGFCRKFLCVERLR
jgi:hypothetical protein